MLSALLIVVLSASAADSGEHPAYRLELEGAGPTDVLEHMEQVYGYQVVNPQASCLKDTVTFNSDKRWPRKRAQQLITRVMANACCDVQFERDKRFRLLPAANPNARCLRND